MANMEVMDEIYDSDNDEQNVEDLEKHLTDNYTNVKSHVSYLSPHKIYLYYNKRLPIQKIKKNSRTKRRVHTLKTGRKTESTHTNTVVLSW